MALGTFVQEDVRRLVEALNFAEKVDRSLGLIREAYEEYGDRLVVANSLGKDSCVVWDLAKRVDPRIPGFIVTTRFKPPATRQFMSEVVGRYPELIIYESNEPVPDRLYATQPDRCCDVLKVEPTRRAIEELGVGCWVTGLRCTEGRTRTDFQEVEERDKGLIKLNPILIWHEREIWQYLALYRVPVNPLYTEGYRSLGCAPCSNITSGGDLPAAPEKGPEGPCGRPARKQAAAVFQPVAIF